ncbi:MAG: hypothetical protein QMD50_00850 [Patescibacteria group bacterium]|nr:hypothetical protein [Patescibacteria group bacterium]
MKPEKFDIDPTARKSEIVIDEALEKIRGLQGDVAAIKGTVKDFIVTEILRTQNMNGEEKAHKLAKYLKDDIENFIFNSNKDADEEIKKDTLQYLQNYLLGDVENLPPNNPTQKNNEKENDFEST